MIRSDSSAFLDTSSGISMLGLEPFKLIIAKFGISAIDFGSDFKSLLFGRDRNINFFKLPNDSGNSLTTPSKFNASKSLYSPIRSGSFKLIGVVSLLP